jgi:hypothetical protein
MPIDPLKPPLPPKPLAPAGPDIRQMRQKFFAGRRDEAQRQTLGQQQQADDLITRRMAAIGQSGSGAAMGAQLKARGEIQAQGANALNELAGQEMQGDMQEALADKDMSFKQGMFDVEQGNKLQELDLAKKQFLLDKDTTEFNRRMAELEMNQEDGGLLGSGGVLGTGLGGKKGILGTGIGKKK